MSLMSRIANLFRREQVDAEIEDEVAAHLAMRAEDNRTRGMSVAEARRDALVRFGNPAIMKERTAESDAMLHLESFWADLHFAVRQLRRSKGYTLTAVSTLALAIGANSAMFTVVHAILLRQLPFDDPDRVLHVENAWAAGLQMDFGSKDDEASFNSEAQSFKTIESAATYTSAGVNASWDPGASTASSRRLSATEVSAQFLNVLGVRPELGRGFLADEDIPGNDQVALISDRLWQGAFSRDPNVLGRTLRMNGMAFKIIGVLPPQMDFPAKTDVWAPTIFDSKTYLREGGAFLTYSIARRRSGVTQQQLDAEFEARAETLQKTQGRSLSPEEKPRLTPVAAELTNSIRSSLWMLTGVVGFVLLIACANIAGLTLVRTSERRAEFAVRAALGASRGRLVRQQLVESILVAVTGGGLGVLCAYAILRLLFVFRPAALDGFDRPAIELIVLGFTALLSMVAGVLFGFYPAWKAGQEDPSEALKTGVWRSSVSGTRLRKALVVGEMGLAFVLMTGAGLLLETIANLNRVPLGFDTDGILSFSISLHGDAYELKDGFTPAFSSFYSRSLDRLRALPGVKDAASISIAPLDSRVADMLLKVELDDKKEKPVGAAPRIISGRYFSVMGIPLLEGREFNSSDTRSSGRVAIITKNLADRLWPGKEAVGQTLHCQFFCEQTTTVVGVVGLSRRFGPLSEAFPEYYLSSTQQDWPNMTFVIRTNAGGNTAALVPAVRGVMQSIDAAQPVYNIATMRERLHDKESLLRFEMFSLCIFASLSTLLAFVGLYGVISYTVTQRTREIGLRIALGAQRGKIRRGLLRESLLLALMGACAGVSASMGLTRYLASVLFGVSARDPRTLVAALSVFVVIALAATLFPALRASRIDPMQALRSE